MTGSSLVLLLVPPPQDLRFVTDWAFLDSAAVLFTMD
jgi:hypothetical protein